MPVTLREMIKNDRDAMFDITDLEYRLYLQDHKAAILNGCEKVYLTPDDMAIYKHRPRKFLADKNLPQGSDWLLCWVNDLSGPEEFHSKKFMYVPNYHQLEDLYTKYRTLKVRFKTMEKELNK